MKALLFVLTIIALTLAVVAGVSAAEQPDSGDPAIPDWYYDSPCQQPEGTTLNDWLGALPWYGEGDLSGSGWDCSQMSARIEWLAENCGYNAVITCRKGTPETYGHCWVDIEGRLYEATGPYWIDLNTADPGYYDADMWFQDIYEAMEYDPDGSEWAWWLKYPELRSR